MGFEVQGKEKQQARRRPGLYVHLTSAADILMQARVEKMAAKGNVTTTEIIRQMIRHCLDDK